MPYVNREVKLSNGIANLGIAVLSGVLLILAAAGSTGWIAIFLWILVLNALLKGAISSAGIGMLLQHRRGTIKEK